MWEIIEANKRKSVFLICCMIALFVVFGYVLGQTIATTANSTDLGAGLVGIVLALMVFWVQFLISYFFGPNILMSMSGARRIQHDDHPTLFNVVEEMKIASGLHRMPDIFIIDDPAPNAFATGRDVEHAKVAVTSGLLERLNRQELQGVIAHELAHINNADILYMLLVGSMMGTIVWISDVGLRAAFHRGHSRTSFNDDDDDLFKGKIIIFLIAIIFMILAPIVAQMIYYAISRKREYLADACAAQYTRYPEGLASALEKISQTPVKLQKADRVTAPLYIINPLKITKLGLADSSSTHPPTSMRIKILRSMAGGAGLANYDEAFRQITGRPVGVVPASELENPETIAIETPQELDGRSDLARKREATDSLWKLNGYHFIGCDCGTTLKVPPDFVGRDVPCPHCQKQHKVEAA
jgi:heat shock protein HtpX